MLQGALKLSHALACFDVPVRGRVCFDAGAAAGGFTTALLDAGAARVYAVDVGYGQLLGSLRQSPRVDVQERTNLARARVDEPVDLVTLDLSYLSVAAAVPQLPFAVSRGADLVALVKPMFELRLGRLPEVPFPALVDALVVAAEGVSAAGWTVVAACGSPVVGHRGAVEGFVHARRACG